MDFGFRPTYTCGQKVPPVYCRAHVNIVEAQVTKRIMFGILTAFALSGCLQSSDPTKQAAINPAVPPGEPAQKVLPVAGVLSGALGAELSERDKQVAFDAQIAALDSGQKRSWRGSKGLFGYVETGAETSRAEGLCREYTHTIYLAGRPQSGKGLACKTREGEWQMVG
jgi:surface antigen